MRKTAFHKMVASGNDFVVIESHQVTPSTSLRASKLPSHQSLAKNICDRKYGVGADGLLLLEKSKKADIRMRIFNADGSEAEMCGNGARCTALYAGLKKLSIETKAGIINAEVNGEEVRIKLTDPKSTRFNIPLTVNRRKIKVNFIDTGVPHTVIFVEGLDKIDAVSIGRLIRYHQRFAPRGTNVNFVEAISKDALRIRTYERGVEDETLACGTGSVASALILSLKTGNAHKVRVHTRGGEILNVYFKRSKGKIADVWLEGRARIVAEGKFFV